MKNKNGYKALTVAAATLLVLATGLLVSSCGSGRMPPEIEGGATADEFDPFALQPEDDYRVRPGDTIRVHFLYNPNLSVDAVEVRTDGRISMPVIGDILVAGKTTDELTTEVCAAYDTYVEDSGYGQVLRAGDEIQLRFTYNPELNQRAFIRPDGGISLLLLGDLRADGVSFKDFEKTVSEGYAQYIKDPQLSIYLLSTETKRIYTGDGEITVMVFSTQPKQVYVGGEVMEPTLVEFRDKLTPLMAIMRAKGMKPSADPKRVIHITRGPNGGAISTHINLAAYIEREEERANLYLRDGDVILVPRTGVTKVGLFIQQYIRDLMPLQGNFSFSYLINRDFYR